jgi:DNA-binding NtrC family response regulator
MSTPPPKLGRILLIDDDSSLGMIVRELMGLNENQIVTSLTLQDGLRLAQEQSFDLILLDHRLPDGDGLDSIEELMRLDRMRPILYITAQTESRTTIEAIKRGAFDYLSKPFDFGFLKQRLEEAIEYRKLTRIPVMVDAKPGTGQVIEHDVLVGRCRAMQDVYKGIGRFASTTGPILIEGEVGTGKEMIARTIHDHGMRAEKPFFKICAMDLVDTELQQTLFGNTLHDQTNVDGYIQTCNGGTILIEEIGGVSLALQSRLLRFMQQPTTNANLIFSTSKPMGDLVKRGLLRSDLYYFLGPFVIRVPALRERIDDFELLVSHFIHRLLKISPTDEHSGPPRVSQAAMNLLKAYDWPGNVAQLKSVLHSVLVESRGAVLATDALHRALGTNERVLLSGSEMHPLSLDIERNWNLEGFVAGLLEEGTDNLYEIAIQKLDQQLLALVLKHTQGNQAQAARILGMTRTSLRRKIASTNIRLADFGSSPPQNENLDIESLSTDE